MRRALRGKWWMLLVVLGMMLLAPFSVGAATAPDALAGLLEAIP